MKNLLNLSGAKTLNKKELQSINGGNRWAGVCFPSEGKCNYYCSETCVNVCGVTSNGYTPHLCPGNQ